jgi:hypothetical protein
MKTQRPKNLTLREMWGLYTLKLAVKSPEWVDAVLTAYYPNLDRIATDPFSKFDLYESAMNVYLKSVGILEIKYER